MSPSTGELAAHHPTSVASSSSTRVLVLYYSSYGHVAAMAAAVAAGAREAGTEVVLKRVPELVPREVAERAGYKLDDATPVAKVAELSEYDALIFGTPTRFGNMAAQMKSFLDQAGGLWERDALVGKIGSVFTCSGSQHGGQESTLLSAHIALMHLGMVIVGLPYTFKGQLRMDEITGCSPYGASTLSGDNDREPSRNELDGARFQGRYVAELARTMALGRARGQRTSSQ